MRWGVLSGKVQKKWNLITQDPVCHFQYLLPDARFELFNQMILLILIFNPIHTGNDKLGHYSTLRTRPGHRRRKNNNRHIKNISKYVKKLFILLPYMQQVMSCSARIIPRQHWKDSLLHSIALLHPSLPHQYIENDGPVVVPTACSRLISCCSSDGLGLHLV